MSRIVWLLLFYLLCHISTTQAKALSAEEVPEPLKPWIDWVLQDQPDLNCPFIYNSYQVKHCGWPSRTRLELTAKSGFFSANWKVYRESWIRLPGDNKHWPLNVSVNNKTAVVMAKDDLPSIKLAEGYYQIKGEFAWDEIPDSLSMPADSGLIELSINGSAITNPSVKAGQLWLKESDTGQRQAGKSENNLDLQVFRKIIDDVPLQVLTHLDLDVSGAQREVKLALPLLPDLLPLQLQSDLPARLESDGQLRVQLRPGHFQIEVLSRAVKNLNSVSFDGKALKEKPVSADGAWPASEIWVFDARPQLRVVEIEQLDAVDPSQTNLPEDWKTLPAFKINQGQTMAFKVIRRGDPEPEPNQLNLTRKLWLDFDGTGYTVNDRITGTMSKGWRLNAMPENRLGKITLDGGQQLITEQPGTGKQGVEVRKGRIMLDADSRLTGTIAAIGATGWEQNFRKASAELNLPPGWQLLAATGVDNVPESWISRWTLLDLFLVLIAALATGRLWNVSWGVAALATLALIWHEPGSPHFVWLNILAPVALIRVLPQGKFLTFVTCYRNASWLALVLISVPFMVSQVRSGLYPQLEMTWQPFDSGRMLTIKEAEESGLSNYSATPSDSEKAAPLAMSDALQSEPSSMAPKNSGAYLQPYESDFNRLDPKAKVQTGPGLPQWQWRRVMLSWNGSVDAGQILHVWYLSPVMSMLLNFLRVILVAVLALLMFGLAKKLTWPMKSSNLLWLGFIVVPLLSMSLPSPAHADFPDQAMLEALRNKLLEEPDCLPACAQIPQMKTLITDRRLSITMQIHAQQSVAVPLPADYEQWFPNTALVDGQQAQSLIRSGNGLWIGLEPGEHTVILDGTAPLLNKFTLPLPLKPNRLTVENSGWDVIGTQENGLAGDVLQFIRRQNSEPHHQFMSNPAVLPPFVRIERTLQLGLDWRVDTQIIRVSPADTAIVMAVPLLPGESVVTEGVRIKDGKAEVNLAANQMTMAWSSTLAKSEKIELLAASSDQWIEVWKANVSPIWHLESDGLAMIHLDNASQWLPEWRPWPGEKITLSITRPAAVEGQTLTIDNSALTINPGKRNRDAVLTLSLRSSQGVQHTISLPEKAILQSVTINGLTQPIRLEGRQLTLPVKPGKQEMLIAWQQPDAMAGMVSTPSVDLGTASVNANLNINLGQDRWVLFAAGPKLGPAVLFWGVLIVIALLSAGLSKIPLTPLKKRPWFLLLVGLSQIPPASAGAVIAWLMLLGWRVKQNSGLRYFNALQVLIAVLTAAALGQLFLAVAQGLLGSPDMQIMGNRSSAYSLRWYQDRSPALLPTATVISVPLAAYRLLMLAWSLWLAVSLLDWLKWGWTCFSSNGLWHKQSGQKQARGLG